MASSTLQPHHRNISRSISPIFYRKYLRFEAASESKPGRTTLAAVLSGLHLGCACADAMIHDNYRLRPLARNVYGKLATAC